MAFPGQAACRYINGAGPDVITAPVSTLTVDPTLPDGTMIADIAVWVTYATYINCDASPAWTENWQVFGGVTGPYYTTNVPGVVFQMYKSMKSQLYGLPGQWTHNWGGNLTFEPDTWNPALRLRFYKYGKVQYGGGNITPATIMRADITWAGGALNGVVTVNMPGITVKTPTCTISDIPVDMGKISVGDKVWKGVGSRGPDVAFNLAVSGCVAGFSGIAFTLTPVTSLQSAPDWHITLDSASTARGLGLQIRRSDNDAIVPICATCKVGLSYDSARGGAASLALKANYIQTAGSLSPGTANSSIIFTVTYP